MGFTPNVFIFDEMPKRKTKIVKKQPGKRVIKHKNVNTHKNITTADTQAKQLDMLKVMLANRTVGIPGLNNDPEVKKMYDKITESQDKLNKEKNSVVSLQKRVDDIEKERKLERDKKENIRQKQLDNDRLAKIQDNQAKLQHKQQEVERKSDELNGVSKEGQQRQQLFKLKGQKDAMETEIKKKQIEIQQIPFHQQLQDAMNDNLITEAKLKAITEATNRIDKANPLQSLRDEYVKEYELQRDLENQKHLFELKKKRADEMLKFEAEQLLEINRRAPRTEYDFTKPIRKKHRKTGEYEITGYKLKELPSKEEQYNLEMIEVLRAQSELDDQIRLQKHKNSLWMEGQMDLVEKQQRIEKMRRDAGALDQLNKQRADPNSEINRKYQEETNKVIKDNAIEGAKLELHKQQTAIQESKRKEEDKKRFLEKQKEFMDTSTYKTQEAEIAAASSIADTMRLSNEKQKDILTQKQKERQLTTQQRAMELLISGEDPPEEVAQAMTQIQQGQLNRRIADESDKMAARLLVNEYYRRAHDAANVPLSNPEGQDMFDEWVYGLMEQKEWPFRDRAVETYSIEELNKTRKLFELVGDYPNAGTDDAVLDSLVNSEAFQNL